MDVLFAENCGGSTKVVVGVGEGERDQMNALTRF